MLNNSYSPTTEEMIAQCLLLKNEDEKLAYLSECASYDYSCPDKCDQWALEFFNDNEEFINE